MDRKLTAILSADVKGYSPASTRGLKDYSGFHLSEETYRFLSRRPG
jgi:hypothetical protein